jgi:hypothetical protein
VLDGGRELDPLEFQATGPAVAGDGGLSARPGDCLLDQSPAFDRFSIGVAFGFFAAFQLVIHGRAFLPLVRFVTRGLL